MTLEKYALLFWEIACLSLLQACKDLLAGLEEVTVDLLDPQVPEVQLETLESKVKLDKEDSQDCQVSFFSFPTLSSLIIVEPPFTDEITPSR